MTQIMPPEWAAQRWIWIGFPHLADEWNGFLAAAQAEIASFARAVAESGQEARLVVPDEAHAALARELAGDAVTLCVHRYGDIWLRDTGPLVVRSASGATVAQRFGFNGWGGKYVMPGDTEIGGLLADEAGLDSAMADWVLEGGAIDVDGTGLGVTTEQCLLNPNRNPHLTREEIEARLRRDLGIERLLWLGDGLINDHTDGHVDNLARFVTPGTLALPVASGEDDPNAAIYANAKLRAEAFGLKVMPLARPGRASRCRGRNEGPTGEPYELRHHQPSGRSADLWHRLGRPCGRGDRCLLSRSQDHRPAGRRGAGRRRELPLRQPADAAARLIGSAVPGIAGCRIRPMFPNINHKEDCPPCAP
jgi:agmatine deiminase